jgi:hypothetical protein
MIFAIKNDMTFCELSYYENKDSIDLKLANFAK